MKLNDQSSAIKNFKKALLIDIKHRDSLLALIRILINLRHYDRANKYLLSALDHFPDDVEFLYGYSLCLYRDYEIFRE